jgi:DNA repair protein RadC
MHTDTGGETPVMKPIKEIPSCDLPREKLYSKGVAALSNAELVAVVIGSGTSGKDVLQVAAEIATLLSSKTGGVTLTELLQVPGIGRAKASQILAGLELSRRFCTPDPDGRLKVRCPSDILPLVSPYARRAQEHFIVVTLNGAGEVLECRVVTVGLLDHSLVHPREVFADAIADRAASIICVHNHPSGTLEPSSQDLAITTQLAKAGEILGIRLLDHLIISSHGFTSFREKGLL